MAVKRGERMPEITLRSLDGKDVPVGGPAARPRFLFMWASW